MDDIQNPGEASRRHIEELFSPSQLPQKQETMSIKEFANHFENYVRNKRNFEDLCSDLPKNILNKQVIESAKKILDPEKKVDANELINFLKEWHDITPSDFGLLTNTFNEFKTSLDLDQKIKAVKKIYKRDLDKFRRFYTVIDTIVKEKGFNGGNGFLSATNVHEKDYNLFLEEVQRHIDNFEGRGTIAFMYALSLVDSRLYPELLKTVDSFIKKHDINKNRETPAYVYQAFAMVEKENWDKLAQYVESLKLPTMIIPLRIVEIAEKKSFLPSTNRVITDYVKKFKPGNKHDATRILESIPQANLEEFLQTIDEITTHWVDEQKIILCMQKFSYIKPKFYLIFLNAIRHACFRENPKNPEKVFMIIDVVQDVIRDLNELE